MSNLQEIQKIVRLINKFPNPPNKDVGEGLNTAFKAMKELRLKQPEIIETETSVIVIIKHEKAFFTRRNNYELHEKS